MATSKKRSFNKITSAPKKMSLKERRKNKRYVLFSLTLLIIASIVFGASRLSRSEKHQISKIEIFGAVGLDINKITEIVKNSTNGSYFNIFNKSMTYIIPKEDIKSNVLSAFPKIKNIELNIKGKNGVDVSVETREPYALLCASIELADICYVADSDGYVYEKYKSEIELNNPIKIILGGISDKYIGSIPLETKRFLSLVNFVNDSRINGINGYAVTESLGREHTMYVKNKDDSITKIHFNEKEDLSRILENLVLFYKESKNKNLEYVDLRFGNNIIYKEFNEEVI